MDNKLKVIGLSGTNGSGKDTVGHMLAERHKYLFISVTELLRDEVRRRGLPIVRENLRMVSAEWRREFGLGVLVDRAVDAYKQQADKYAGVVMASLRNPGESTRLHELGGILVWVDADPQVRYQRVRGAGRGRDGEDDKTFEQFLAEEQAEMHKPADGDDASLDISAVKEAVDVTLVNNGSDIETLKTDAEQALGL
jgi:dephospho-CoA kinase